MSWNDNLHGPALNIAGTTDSPLRVMAGPLTGKSFAMQRRVARLIEVAHVDPNRIQNDFAKYWEDQRVLALQKLSEEEHLDQRQFASLIEAYIFTGQEPQKDDVLKCLEARPGVLKAREIGERIGERMKEYVEVFVRGMVA